MQFSVKSTRRCLAPLLMLFPGILAAQTPQGGSKTDLQLILERLDRLEQENRDLAAQVSALRSELAVARGTAPVNPAAAPAEAAPAQAQSAETPAAGAASTQAPLDERVAVQEQRTAELEQTKVGAASRLPISLTGMVLFNSFLNGRSSGSAEDPLIASPVSGPSGTGAALSQSILGLTFQGPRVLGGGLVNGQIHMDFWGGSSSSLNHLIRLRVATVSIDWKNQSLTVGQDKPIISPRDPTSLAQVAYAPLTYTGNPWLWQPQIRFEQRVALGADSGIRARVGVYETSEPTFGVISEYASSISSARPAIEGRFEIWHKFGKDGRIEIAPGFHTSQTHVIGLSIPSRLFSTDWLIQPLARVQLTGMFFTGQNAAGIGTLPDGFTIFSPYRVRAVGTTGGWTQFSFLATRRLTFNIYGGQESHQTMNLLAGEITRNFEYAGNAIYKLGSNVVLGIEAAQVRTNYLQLSNHLVDHYDAALGYLF